LVIGAEADGTADGGEVAGNELTPVLLRMRVPERFVVPVWRFAAVPERVSVPLPETSSEPLLTIPEKVAGMLLVMVRVGSQVNIPESVSALVPSNVSRVPPPR